MSEAQARSERIRDKIAASQDRLRRDAEAVPPASARAALPDAYPPDSYRSLVAEYPWLVVATGAGLGLLAGALVPKRFGAKLGGRLMTAATLAAGQGYAAFGPAVFWGMAGMCGLGMLAAWRWPPALADRP